MLNFIAKVVALFNVMTPDFVVLTSRGPYLDLCISR